MEYDSPTKSVIVDRLSSKYGGSLHDNLVLFLFIYF